MSLTSRMSRRRFPAASGRVAAGLAGVLAVAVAAGCGSSATTPKQRGPGNALSGRYDVLGQVARK
jgi:hypothetical protein